MARIPCSAAEPHEIVRKQLRTGKEGRRFASLLMPNFRWPHPFHEQGEEVKASANFGRLVQPIQMWGPLSASVVNTTTPPPPLFTAKNHW